MKTEFIDVSETQKNLVVEIPSDVVDSEIERVARDYSRAARIPGFRPGKVPARLVRQRFRDRILHDVAHDLIPRAIDEALRERGVEPVDSPDIRDVVVEEGQPLKFTATFETIPPVDPGEYRGLTVRRPEVTVAAEEVERTLARLRERAARVDPVEDRPAEPGDTLVVDLQRRVVGPLAGEASTEGETGTEAGAPQGETDVAVEIGATANPPGFDDQLIGLTAGDEKTFTLRFSSDHPIAELAGSEVEYQVVVKAVKRRILPDLDDEFAKDIGPFDTLEALRTRIRENLMRDAQDDAERQVRGDIMRQLAERVRFDPPAALVRREVDRRLEDLVGRLIEQGIDPRRANIDWEQLRERQQEAAAMAVRGAVVLDEVARREQLTVSDEDLEQEIRRHAERTGRTAAAVRAALEKDGGIARVQAGLRREKAIDFLLSHARIISV